MISVGSVNVCGDEPLPGMARFRVCVVLRKLVIVLPFVNTVMYGVTVTLIVLITFSV